MDNELKAMIKEVLQDYIDNGLIVKVRVTFDETAGIDFRTDLVEKAISDGLSNMADRINTLAMAVYAHDGHQ